MAERGGNVGWVPLQTAYAASCRWHCHLSRGKQIQKRTRCTHDLGSEVRRRSLQTRSTRHYEWGGVVSRCVDIPFSIPTATSCVLGCPDCSRHAHDNQVTTESLLSVIKCFKRVRYDGTAARRRLVGELRGMITPKRPPM